MEKTIELTINNLQVELENTQLETVKIKDEFQKELTKITEVCEAKIHKKEEMLAHTLKKLDDLREDFDSMKLNFENAITEKDKQISTQRKTIEAYDEKLFKSGAFEIKEKSKSFTENVKSGCKIGMCIEDEDEHKLECNRCKNLFHYNCTTLPVYQIAHFLTTNYRRYICIKCTTIPEYVTDIMKDKKVSPNVLETMQISTQTTLSTEYIDEVLDKNETLEEDLSDTAKELERVNNEKVKLKSTIIILKQQVADNEENGTKLLKDIDKKEIVIRSQKGLLQSQQEKLKEVEREFAVSKTMTIKSKQCAAVVNKSSNKLVSESSNTDLLNSTTLDKKLELLSTNILDTVAKIVDEKLVNMGNKFQSLVKIPDKIDESYKTFKEVLTQNNSTNETANFKTIMNEDRNDQLVQERQRTLRSANLIVHGVAETNGVDSQKDEEFVDALFEKIGINSTPDSITRLGKAETSKIRPLRIKLANENEKEKVMSRLSNLKDAEPRFKQVSITPDFTQEEREIIRSWVDKAKEKNRTENGNFVWRTRGSPKNGMRLVRFAKQQPAAI